MVSYFCHKMKSFVYIGHNESFNNSEILSDKIHKSSMNIQKQSAVNKQNSNTISKISGQEPSVNQQNASLVRNANDAFEKV